MRARCASGRPPQISLMRVARARSSREDRDAQPIRSTRPRARMLVEVQVPNPQGELMPGMYANVTLRAARENPPLLIPSEALVARAQGTMAAVVDRAGSVHFTPIQVGRDSGTELEVLAGLEEGMKVIVNPNDKVREGVAVETRPFLRPRPAGTPRRRPRRRRKRRVERGTGDAHAEIPGSDRVRAVGAPGRGWRSTRPGRKRQCESRELASFLLALAAALRAARRAGAAARATPICCGRGNCTCRCAMPSTSRSRTTWTSNCNAITCWPRTRISCARRAAV